MERPVIQLEACTYNNIGKHTPVLNYNSLEYFTYIHIDGDLIRGCGLWQVDEIDPNGLGAPVTHLFEHESKCWVKCVTKLLNMKPGQHIYKLSFADRCTGDVFSLYASYIIQSDCPEKPYIYIDRTAKES